MNYPEHTPISREDVLSIWKKFAHLGDISKLDFNDTEAVKAQQLFNKWNNQEDVRIQLLPQEQREQAEKKLNHEKTMLWVDAGFHDTAYLTEVLSHLSEDGENTTKEFPDTRGKIASAMRKVRTIIRENIIPQGENDLITSMFHPALTPRQLEAQGSWEKQLAIPPKNQATLEVEQMYAIQVEWKDILMKGYFMIYGTGSKFAKKLGSATCHPDAIDLNNEKLRQLDPPFNLTKYRNIFHVSLMRNAAYELCEKNMSGDDDNNFSILDEGLYYLMCAQTDTFIDIRGKDIGELLRDSNFGDSFGEYIGKNGLARFILHSNLTKEDKSKYSSEELIRAITSKFKPPELVIFGLFEAMPDLIDEYISDPSIDYNHIYFHTNGGFKRSRWQKKGEPYFYEETTSRDGKYFKTTFIKKDGYIEQEED